ncbi:Protein of unknown function [Cotesia congregata]|uniref:Uncharacterized protein n=1 Tax=Cotesia congregata TaxID=51543 RepID=A0A8J2HGH4_COTCN|nr:Protein of unknown function [Cotesia congregata]
MINIFLANSGGSSKNNYNLVAESGDSSKDNGNADQTNGYVAAVEGPKIVGAERLLLFKIYLANDNGEKLQVVAWNDKARSIQSKISVNQNIHIDGAYVNPKPRGKYNVGTADYELIIQSNTKVHVLDFRKITEEKPKEAEPIIPLSTFQDLTSMSSQDVRVRGFVKSEIALLKKKESWNDTLVGSITDGEYKLEVKVSGVTKDLEIPKCSHVEVSGCLQAFANPMHILVRNPENVKIIDDTKMSFVKMIKVTKPLIHKA